jgi:hypothetical protein
MDVGDRGFFGGGVGCYFDYIVEGSPVGSLSNFNCVEGGRRGRGYHHDYVLDPMCDGGITAGFPVVSRLGFFS